MKTLFLLALTLLNLNLVYAQHGGSATYEDLKGMIATHSCSGSLVAFGEVLDENNKGIILSAGHCARNSDDHVNGKALWNIISKEYGVYYFIDRETKKLMMSSFPLFSQYYSTMTYEDITLFKMAISYKEAMDKGMTIFKVSDSLPKVGQKLKVTSALWKETMTCTVEKILVDNEDEFNTIGVDVSPVEMRNSILLDKNCKAKGGWSGSPLYDPKTNTIYGVASRVITNQKTGETRFVASSTYMLKRCFTKDLGRENFISSACELPR